MKLTVMKGVLLPMLHQASCVVLWRGTSLCRGLCQLSFGNLQGISQSVSRNNVDPEARICL